MAKQIIIVAYIAVALCASYQHLYGMLLRGVGPFDRRLLALAAKTQGPDLFAKQLREGRSARHWPDHERDIMRIETFPCIKVASIFARTDIKRYTKYKALLAQDIFDFIDTKESKEEYRPAHIVRHTTHGRTVLMPNNYLDINTWYWHKKEHGDGLPYIECFTSFTVEQKKEIEEVLAEVRLEKVRRTRR